MQLRAVPLVLTLALASCASPAFAAPAHTIVGDNAATAFNFHQQDGDCEEAAVDLVIGAVTGSRLKETTIDLYARNAGILFRDGTHYGDGSNWFGPNGVEKLAAHYGLNATVGSHTIATVEADLAAGDRIVAFVDSETMWATLSEAQLVQALGTPPAGLVWSTGSSAYPSDHVADHVLVLDSIDKTTHTATVSDTGMGLTYTVTLDTWSQAVAGSDYSYAVITPSAAKR